MQSLCRDYSTAADSFHRHKICTDLKEKMCSWRLLPHCTFINDATTLMTISSGPSTKLLVDIAEFNTVDLSPIIVLALSFQAEFLPETVSKTFLFETLSFFRKVSDYVRTNSSSEVSIISRKTVDIACKLGCARIIVKRLLNIAEIMAPSPTCLTSIYTDFLQACIASQMYSYGSNFVSSKIILEIDLEKAPLHSIDYLKYFYYASILHIGVQNYSAAISCLVQLLRTPATDLSAVAVEALKKLKILSLLEYGHPYVVPKSFPLVIVLFEKKPLIAYDALIESFVAKDFKMLQKSIEIHIHALIQDGNLGLSKQLTTSLKLHQISALTCTYLTISLEDISKSIGTISIEEVESHLFTMITTGKINATIDQKTSMVHFKDDTLQTSSTDAIDTIHILSKHIHESIQLTEYLRNLQREVLSSPEYIRKLNSNVTSSSSDRLGRGEEEEEEEEEGGGMKGLVHSSGAGGGWMSTSRHSSDLYDENSDMEII